MGGEAEIMAGGVTYRLGFKEALYLGKGVVDISFDSIDPHKPAKLYINSAPAHHDISFKKSNGEGCGSCRYGQSGNCQSQNHQ